MSDQQKITEFSQSSSTAEKGELGTCADSSEEFGWGSFGKPPQNWPVRRVKELFEIQKESADPDELDNGELVRLYSMPAFDDGEEPKLTQAGDIGSKKFRVPSQALLFSKLNISKKRFWLVNHSHDEPALCSTEYWPLLPADGLNLEFYLQYFNSDSFIDRPRLSTSSTTNSHQRIKSNLFDKVRLPVPPLPEQRKIATVLYTVDRTIQKNQQIYEKAREVEEASKTKFFTRGYSGWELDESVGWRCRANKFPKDWKVKPAEELMNITRGASPRPRSDDSLFGGEIPWIKIGDAERGISKSIKNVDSYVTEKGKQKSKFVEKGTLLVANSGATCGFSVFAGVDGCVHDGWLILREHDGLVSDFLYHYINWNYNYLQSLSLGSAQTNLSTGLFGRLDIPLPPIQEQRQIVEALDSINQVATHASKEVERLKRLKRGLMQDLLSGTVRTTDTNIQIPEEIAKHG